MKDLAVCWGSMLVYIDINLPIGMNHTSPCTELHGAIMKTKLQNPGGITAKQVLEEYLERIK